MSKRINWAIIGTGNISKKFAQGLALSAFGKLHAVGSRSLESAQAFADQFGAPKPCGSYEQAIEDPRVDAVYVGLPNHLHAPVSVKVIEAGKAVLCEKPLAMNFAEAAALIEFAAEHGVFLMEAFMYRLHPQTSKIVELVRDQVVGPLRIIQADFAFNFGDNAQNVRLFNEMGGGGIMDVGCYCTSISRLVAGVNVQQDFAEPADVSGHAMIGPDSRIDHWATGAAKFPAGVMAAWTCGLQAGAGTRLQLTGRDGQIDVAQPFIPGNQASTITVKPRQGDPQTFAFEQDDKLFANEADAVAQALAQGKTQIDAPGMTWNDTLGNMKTLDRWRHAAGLVFDCERPARITGKHNLIGKPVTKRPNTKMQYRELAGLDKPVSKLGIGTMGMICGEVPMTAAMLDSFFELGGNCLDTGHIYNTEANVGQWIQQRGVRDDLVIIGKGIHTPNCFPDAIEPELAISLDRLGTDHVDIYLMHRDNPSVPASEFVDALNEVKRKGLVRRFGGSNWSIDRMQQANDYAAGKGLEPLTCSSLNVALGRWNEPMWTGAINCSEPTDLAWHKQNNVAMFAWSSLANGFYSGRFRPETAADRRSKDVVRVWWNDDNLKRMDRLHAMAREMDVDPVVLSLAWVLNQPLDIFALVGPWNPLETRALIEAQTIELTDLQCQYLDLLADAPR